MSCNCETYTCVEVWLNLYNTGTALDIEATETGTWTGRIEFNSTWREFGVSVIDGEDIAIFTSLFNENYIHELRLYNIAGQLVNCYKLKTMMSNSVADAPVPDPPGNITWQWGTVTTAQADTVQSNLWKGDISPIIWINSAPIDWAAAGITQNAITGTLDFTAVAGVSGSISFQYKDLPS